MFGVALLGEHLSSTNWLGVLPMLTGLSVRRGASAKL
jgi:hypothetical protein